MKVFELIGGIFILTTVFLACSGQNPMTILCSVDWSVVTVHPFLLNSDVYVHFHELQLGLGCPVTHVQPYICKFTYQVTECGIRAKVNNMVMYSTKIRYASKTTSSKYTVPVSCSALQDSQWLTTPYSEKESSKIGTTEYSKTGYEVFTLSQFSQKPNCNCPPCAFNEGGYTQASHH
ncbi:LOW QUALITY PROTEIN: placenta-specific protein 1 [Rhynchonycteris naso]